MSESKPTEVLEPDDRRRTADEPDRHAEGDAGPPAPTPEVEEQAVKVVSDRPVHP